MRAVNMGLVLGTTAIGLGGFAPGAGAQTLTLLDSFNPDEGGSINSIGYRHRDAEVFVHFEHNALVHVYDRAGNFLRSFTKPSGIGGNDDDLDFPREGVVVGSTFAPPDSMLLIENDNTPPRVYAARASDGVVLAQQDFSNSLGTWVGGAWSHARDTLFAVSYTADVVHELDLQNGTALNSLPVEPAGSPSFDIFYGDIDILRRDGNIYAVSSSQNSIRVLSPTGVWLGDLDVDAMGIRSMTGIAFDDRRGEAWISSTNGTIYRVGGFDRFECQIDFDEDTNITTNDFFVFLTLYQAGDLTADMTGDGDLNTNDFFLFLALFQGGC